MRNSQIGKIAISTSHRNRAKFNVSHDVNTTAAYGDTQPLIGRLCVPGTKSVVSIDSLVRLAPMVAPCFGRLKFKTWSSFVPISDLLHNFPSMLAQEPISRGNNTFVPTSLPRVAINRLSILTLFGARMTAYAQDLGLATDAGNETQYLSLVPVKVGDGQIPTELQTAENLRIYQYFSNKYSYSRNFGPALDNKVYGSFNAGLLLPEYRNDGQSSSLKTDFFIPMCFDAEFGARPFDIGTYDSKSNKWISENNYVSLDSADEIIEYMHDVYVLDNPTDPNSAQKLHRFRIVLAFKLGDYGKRLRKILLGLGYQINFTSTTEVSLVPLFAYFKAYFDVFGLCLYDAWETTFCSKLLTYIDFHNEVDLGKYFRNFDTPAENEVGYLLFGFFNELANTFVTDKVDFVSAHVKSTAVSPALNLSKQFIDVNPGVSSDKSDVYKAMITETDSSGFNAAPHLGDSNGHAMVNGVFHGQLDSEYLKKLYVWTNRNTIAGRKIAELLRAQGLGKFVDDCKSNFIGFTEVDVNIVDVVSNSDTFDQSKPVGSQGSVLGEYGGRGIGYKDGKSLVFENDEYGYWITLCSVVPESGYCQAFDPTLFATDKMSLYNPEFDGLGMEASRKLLVCGSLDWSKQVKGAATGALDANFGFVPRYTGFKMLPNKMNGDMSVRSRRDTYLPYTLDKFMFVGEQSVTGLGFSNKGGNGKGCLTRFRTFPKFSPSDLPSCGNVWRYVAKWEWLGNFNRIFAVSFGLADVNRKFVSLDSEARFQMYNDSSDNFLIQNVVHFEQYAPMLPVEESFETKTDGNNGSSDVSIEKA